MIGLLRELCASGKKAGIYTDEQEPSRFIYGKVLAVDENWVVLQLASPDGAYDGVVVMDTGCVFRIETDGKYGRRMEKLCSDGSFPDFCEKIDGENIMLSVLKIAKDRRTLVSFELCQSGYDDITGFVETADEGKCRIRQFTCDGEADGVSAVSLEDISQISFEGEDERRIMRLMA